MDPLDLWDYELPPERIAKFPLPERHDSRLMVVPVAGGPVVHDQFLSLASWLRPGDLLVANDTRVMASRLRAHRRSGAAIEVLLLGPGPGVMEAMVRPGRRVHDGEELALVGGGRVRILGRAADPSLFRVILDRDPVEVMAQQGEIPLPPYLERTADASDSARYQTMFAGPLGASAAPTAGLHFTPTVLDQLRERGVGMATVTLHVGLGTFRPPRPEDLEAGKLHIEPYIIPEATVAAVAAARGAGGRIIAIGTTSARALEAASASGELKPGYATTDILIQPGYKFRAIDGLITNFHLPRSSLLMLVGALIGRERLLSVYAEAVGQGYRFYSYGDAMLLV